MLILLSPAKTQNFEQNYELPQGIEAAQPIFKKQIQVLIDELKAKTPEQIQNLMSVSESIASLNFERFQNFSNEFSQPVSKPALLTFDGDVYKGIEAETYDAEDWNFANNHLVIISGLYGLLSPSTLIQPYRLEMKTKLEVSLTNTNNLYSFWSERLSTEVKDSYNPDVIINLASKEYSKAILTKSNSIPVINITFKEKKHDTYKIIAIYAKIARGVMANYIIKNKITSTSDIKKFTQDGYRFSPEESTDTDLVFLRG